MMSKCPVADKSTFSLRWSLLLNWCLQRSDRCLTWPMRYSIDATATCNWVRLTIVKDTAFSSWYCSSSLCANSRLKRLLVTYRVSRQVMERVQRSTPKISWVIFRGIPFMSFGIWWGQMIFQIWPICLDTLYMMHDARLKISFRVLPLDDGVCS